MPLYRHIACDGRADDIFIIEDPTMETKSDGCRGPGWYFVDRHTVKAHPAIIEALLESAERLWCIEEILTVANREHEDAHS